MPERATVFETTQLGLETTPGTAVPALKRLLCTGIEISPEIPVNPYRPFGAKSYTTAVPLKESATGNISGVLCPYDLTYLVSSYFGQGTVATPGGGTDSRLWTFLPKQYDVDNVATFTVEKGSRIGAERMTYGLVNSLGFNFTPEGCEVSGSMLARGVTENAQMSTNEVQLVDVDGATSGTFTLTYATQTTAPIAFDASNTVLQAALEALSNIALGDVYVGTKPAADQWNVEFRGNLRQTDVALMTLDDALLVGGGVNVGVTEATKGVPPTDLAAVPVSPRNVCVYVADSVGNLATGKLERCLEVSLNFPERFSTLMTVDCETTTWAAAVERAVEGEGTLIVEHDSVAAALVENLRASETRYMMIEVEQGEIEVGYPFIIRYTFAFKFTSNTRGDNDDVYASTFNFVPIYDSGLGTYFKTEIQTDLTAL